MRPALIAAILMLAAAAAPKDAKTFKGRQYKLIPERCSWHVASRRCEALGGGLAAVRSNEENRFLTGLAAGRSVWLGATDEDDEGGWRWADGAPLTFRNWAAGRPDNRSGRGHYMSLGPDGAWRDLHAGGCSIEGERRGLSVTGFICEWGPETKKPAAPRPRRPAPTISASRLGDTAYMVVLGKVPWHVAVRRAGAMGGRLACVETKAQNDFLTRLARGRRLWLGASDRASEGDWRWISGRKLKYANWRRGEPNNYGKREHYLHLNEDGTWNDTNAGGFWDENESVVGYIVEWPVSALKSGQVETPTHRRARKTCANCHRTCPAPYRFCPWCGKPFTPRDDSAGQIKAPQLKPGIEP